MRKLLGWSKDTLAGLAGVSSTVIYNIESGRVYPSPVRMDAIRAALETAGVEFLTAKDGGVALMEAGAQ